MTLSRSARRSLTLDTSAILAMINTKDLQHTRVKTILLQHPQPYFISTGVLAEIAYLLETRYGFLAIDTFLKDIRRGVFQLEFESLDLERAHVLVERYQNLPLGLADALVIACAELHGGAVVSLDRHFWVVAGEGTIQVQP